MSIGKPRRGNPGVDSGVVARTAINTLADLDEIATEMIVKRKASLADEPPSA